MRRESTGVRSETDSQRSTEPTEPDWVAETTEPSEGFSLVDPLTYAPLLLVGAVLVVFPDPATTLLGIGCLVVGVVLAVVDLLSADG
ncbi:hypothetical protein [Halohasta salina]|uniref:hypothetical protein n=1 Tax=Halohasta salina TaxID=2961621 RepID=UPI0020A527BF|nr:hypothetical protein [Halohasta salina]